MSIRAVHEDSSNVKYVITLIHGTWATKASWTQPDSKLCSYLRNAFGNDATYFYRFAWKGHNSVLARKSAASQLADELKILIAKFPSARHFIIAHSHGGNIAYHTLRESSLAQIITGVICLSTPFLQPKPRLLEPLTKFWLFLTFLLFLFVTISNLTERSVDGVIVGTGGMIISLVGIGLFFGSKVLSDRLHKEMILAPILCPAAIIRTKWDEALVFLVASQLLTWVVHKGWLLLMSPVALIQKFLGRIFGFKKWRLWFVVTTLLGLYTLGPTVVICGDTVGASFYLGDTPKLIGCGSDRIPEDYGVIGLLLVGLPYLVMLGYILGCFTLILVMVMSALVSIIPFGVRLTLSHIFLDVAISGSPPGTFDSFDIQNTSRTQAWLQHSKSYEAEESLAFITDWIHEHGDRDIKHASDLES